jgi:hypothetical protein
MTFEASGSGGRADCNNEGAIIFFSVLKDFSSGGCGNIFENLDRPLPGVVGKFDDISIGAAKGHLRYSLWSLRSTLGFSVDSVVTRATSMADHFSCLKENVSWAPLVPWSC